MLRYLLLLSFWISSAALAKDTCGINEYIKSAEGQEKLSQMYERAKSLIVSKLTDLEVKESDIDIKVVLPKSLKEKNQRQLSVEVKANEFLTVWGEEILVTEIENDIKSEDKSSVDHVCGVEISINGGNLQNKKTGQDFGNLGKVKEFIRLN